MLSREEIKEFMAQWIKVWDDRDLNGIIEMSHEDIFFENWTGAKVRGKEALRKAWTPWFANHGGFQFTDEDLFIDEAEQKVLYQWRLDWPSFEKGWEGKPEARRGVDVLHFKDGKIIQKLTYSKTSIEIEEKILSPSAWSG